LHAVEGFQLATCARQGRLLSVPSSSSFLEPVPFSHSRTTGLLAASTSAMDADLMPQSKSNPGGRTEPAVADQQAELKKKGPPRNKKAIKGNKKTASDQQGDSKKNQATQKRNNKNVQATSSDGQSKKTNQKTKNQTKGKRFQTGRNKNSNTKKPKSSGLISAINIDLNSIRKKRADKKKNSVTNKVRPESRNAEAEFATEFKKRGISLTELHPGDVVSGKVVRLLPFGALVQTPYDIPGEPYGCAMLHISRITSDNDDGSSSRPKNITSVLKLGQNIQDARVVSINQEKGTVGISLRQQVKRVALRTIRVGDEVEGKVVRMKAYGVFVDIGTKRDALLHISRMSLYKVNNLNDYAKVGQRIKARVIRADPDDTKNIAISLLSPENDRFVDRRERDKQRNLICEQLVLNPPRDAAELEETKRQLLEIDHQIRQEMEEFQKRETGARMMEV